MHNVAMAENANTRRLIKNKSSQFTSRFYISYADEIAECIGCKPQIGMYVMVYVFNVP